MTTAAGNLLNHRRKRHLENPPLPRHFHGPQRPCRIRLSFCPGASFPLLPPEARSLAFDMGNFVSRLFGGHPRDDGLGMYKGWVGALQEARDLTVATTEEAGTTAHLVSRKFGDPRKAALEAVPRPQKRTKPHYRDALKASRKNDSRLEELAFEVKLYEEKLAELRKSDQAPKEDLSEPFKPLTAEEETEVHDCLYGSGPSKVLVSHESSNIEISKEKFRCLRPSGWLNDEVINLYLELLKERGKREPNRFLKCHFFNTFFYKKLACGKNGYDYKSVKRWTSHRKLGYELIECDKIFVPVHKNIHWCLAIINMKENTFQYLDSLGGMATNVARVLVRIDYDSLIKFQFRQLGKYAGLARYIADEVKDKSNKMIDTSSWHEELVDYIPLQQNGWDCGMFMLKYIDFHSRGLSLSFSQEHMEYFRKRTAKEILRLRAD